MEVFDWTDLNRLVIPQTVSPCTSVQVQPVPATSHPTPSGGQSKDWSKDRFGQREITVY